MDRGAVALQIVSTTVTVSFVDEMMQTLGSRAERISKHRRGYENLTTKHEARPTKSSEQNPSEA